MVQARSLLVAIALTVTVPSVVQARSFPCWMVRMYVDTHSKAQQRADAKKYGVTEEEKREHRVCFKGAK